MHWIQKKKKIKVAKRLVAISKSHKSDDKCREENQIRRFFLVFCPGRFIPESVRWIISQGNNEKAEVVTQKVAKFNKAENFPNSAIQPII